MADLVLIFTNFFSLAPGTYNILQTDITNREASFVTPARTEVGERRILDFSFGARNGHIAFYLSLFSAFPPMPRFLFSPHPVPLLLSIPSSASFTPSAESTNIGLRKQKHGWEGQARGWDSECMSLWFFNVLILMRSEIHLHGKISR